MGTVDQIVGKVRREFPHAVHAGTFAALFQRHDAPANILAVPGGPPVAVDVAAGSYSFLPDASILTEQEYQQVCERLRAMARPHG
ncbi:hypothetical protein [Pseudodonghicola sp.]|uniref:hypothetical protein n=1 Tax=Pseudodonghicola sp. TaxID=1969463 RepID=UPI003A979335